MKKIIALFFLLFSISFYGQWVQLTENFPRSLSDVFCINENTVIVVGDSGVILKTIDGGTTWVPKSSGTTEALWKVRFVNAQVGYIVGNHGTLLKTSDGGESWSPIATGATDSELSGLSCVNENIFFIGAESSYVRKTINGGLSFEIVNLDEDFYDNIQFINDMTGYANTYGGLFKTVDGGNSWFQIHNNVSSFYFLDENIGFVNAADGFYKTIDGGDNFTFLSDFPFVVGQLFATSENVVWGVTHFVSFDNPPNYTMRGEIDNSGVFHETIATPYFHAVYFANPTIGYAITGFSIYKNSTGLLAVKEEQEKNSLKICPNPSSGQINILFNEAPTDLITIEIKDCLGKVIYSQLYQPLTHILIPTTMLSKGIYFISIGIHEKIQTQKLIIN